jgi:hypothetical protein
MSPHMSYWVESDETRIIIIVVSKFYQQKILGPASFKIRNKQLQHVFQSLESFVPFAYRFENETMC